MAKSPIMRHEIADYLNTGTESTKEWALMGAGFTSIDEEPNAQTDSVKYVNDRSTTTSIIGYETSFSFEADHIKEEAAIDAIYNIARNHHIGSDAELEYCRVELWNAAEGTNTFEARLFRVAVEVSSMSGENKMGMSGSLNCIGDPVLGTFNTQTRTFTPATTTP